jgi:hypothetical protein
MIEKGLLPSRMVGNQRRLPLQDVLAYKADNRAKRRAAPRWRSLSRTIKN